MRIDHGGLEKFMAYGKNKEIAVFSVYLTVFPYFGINFFDKPRIKLKYNVMSSKG
jgi:hypothetical protein